MDVWGEVKKGSAPGRYPDIKKTGLTPRGARPEDSLSEVDGATDSSADSRSRAVELVDGLTISTRGERITAQRVQGRIVSAIGERRCRRCTPCEEEVQRVDSVRHVHRAAVVGVGTFRAGRFCSSTEKMFKDEHRVGHVSVAVCIGIATFEAP